MTAANTRRSIPTFALTSTRVPRSDPASTPSITGMARPGSMYPRLR